MSAGGVIVRLWHAERGVSALEFALMLPILVMFSAGTIEYSRLILLTQKLQNGAFILADLTARDRELKVDTFGHLFLAVGQVIQPFDFAHKGRAIVTSVGADLGDNPVVNWQCDGAGHFAVGSAVGGGLAGDAAALPTGLEITTEETVIAAELFYDFEPLFGIGLAPRVIRRAAYFKPRLGELETSPCPE